MKKVVKIFLFLIVLGVVLGGVYLKFWYKFLQKEKVGLNHYYNFSSNIPWANGIGPENLSLNSTVINSSSFNPSINSSSPNFTRSNIAYKVWGDQDLNLFRENIKYWHIPNLNTITYNGVFSDYHFSLPQWKCEKMFCPLVALTTGEDLDGKIQYYIHIGLGSNIKNEDFKRPNTNFIILIDKSGSMWERIDSYYYLKDSKNNHNCWEWFVYFKEGNKCVAKDKLVYYEEKVKEYSSNLPKIELVKKAVIEMVDKMRPDDRIAVVLFDNKWKIVVPFVKIKNINKQKFVDHIKQIVADGGTNLEDWLKKVEELVSDDILSDWYQTRLIILTDAMPNLWDYSAEWLSKILKNLADKWVYFTFVWVWIDFQQAFVQKIAGYRWANYFFVNSSYDIYRRLVDEFDYNFFPMVYDLSFKVSNPELVDDVYGIDSNLIKQNWELFHINTLFPTPPTADGYRWSIILLKLKQKLNKPLKFEVSYKLSDWKVEKVNTVLYPKLENDVSAKKWIVLVNYVKALKKAILDQDIDLLDKLENYMKNNKKYFTWDDEKMFEKEIKTIEKLKNLLKNWVKPERDYWDVER